MKVSGVMKETLRHAERDGDAGEAPLPAAQGSTSEVPLD